MEEEKKQIIEVELKLRPNTMTYKDREGKDWSRHFSTVLQTAYGEMLLYPNTWVKVPVTAEILERDILPKKDLYEIKPFKYTKLVPIVQETPKKEVEYEFTGANFKITDKGEVNKERVTEIESKIELEEESVVRKVGRPPKKK